MGGGVGHGVCGRPAKPHNTSCGATFGHRKKRRTPTKRLWVLRMIAGPAFSTTTAPLLAEPRTHQTARWCGGRQQTCPRHPQGEDHIRLWTLLWLNPMVNRVKARM